MDSPFSTFESLIFMTSETCIEALCVCACVKAWRECVARGRSSFVSPHPLPVLCTLFMFFWETFHFQKKGWRGKVFYYSSSNRLRVEHHLSSFGNRTSESILGSVISSSTTDHWLIKSLLSPCLATRGSQHLPALSLGALISSCGLFQVVLISCKGRETFMSMI